MTIDRNPSIKNHLVGKELNRVAPLKAYKACLVGKALSGVAPLKAYKSYELRPSIRNRLFFKVLQIEFHLSKVL